MKNKSERQTLINKVQGLADKNYKQAIIYNNKIDEFMKQMDKLNQEIESKAGVK